MGSHFSGQQHLVNFFSFYLIMVIVAGMSQIFNMHGDMVVGSLSAAMMNDDR